MSGEPPELVPLKAAYIVALKSGEAGQISEARAQLRAALEAYRLRCRQSDFDAVRRLAEEQDLRLLKHTSNRKMGAWKVKDRDGNMVCWPSPPDVVEGWLRSRGPIRGPKLSETQVTSDHSTPLDRAESGSV